MARSISVPLRKCCVYRSPPPPRWPANPHAPALNGLTLSCATRPGQGSSASFDIWEYSYLYELAPGCHDFLFFSLWRPAEEVRYNVNPVWNKQLNRSTGLWYSKSGVNNKRDLVLPEEAAVGTSGRDKEAVESEVGDVG